MQEKIHKTNSENKPKITKLGKAKDLIAFIPQLEAKNSDSASDEFTSFIVS